MGGWFAIRIVCIGGSDRKSTRLNSSHANIYTLSLHDALPICTVRVFLNPSDTEDYIPDCPEHGRMVCDPNRLYRGIRSEEHTSELQSRQYLHSFPTRRSSDLYGPRVLESFRHRGLHSGLSGAWADGLRSESFVSGDQTARLSPAGDPRGFRWRSGRL